MNRTQSPLLLFLLASALPLLVGCGDDGTPSDPFNVGIAKTVTMLEVKERPRLGGRTTSLDIMANGDLVAVVDGDLLRFRGDDEPEVIDNSRSYIAAAVGPEGRIVAHTATELLTFPSGSTTPRVVSIPLTGPISANGPIATSAIDFGPDGRAYVTLISAQPRTYVFHADREGTEWTQLEFEGGLDYLRSRGGIAVTPSGTLLAGNFEGILATTTLGASWQVRTRGVPNEDLALAVGSDGTIYRYSPGNAGLGYSTDGGENFVEAVLSIFPPYFYRLRAGSGENVWALANTTQSGGATPLERPMSLMHSTDRGETWKVVLRIQGETLDLDGPKVAVGVSDNLRTRGTSPGGIVTTQNNGLLWESNGLRVAGEVADFMHRGDGDLLMVFDGAIQEQTSLRFDFLSAPIGLDQVVGGALGEILWHAREGLAQLDRSNGMITEVEGQGEIAPLRDGSYLLYNYDEGKIDLLQEGVRSVRYEGPLLLEQIVEERPDELIGVERGSGAVYLSSDRALTWTKVDRRRALACNRAGACVTLDQREEFLFIAPDSSFANPLIFNGPTITPEAIRKIAFDRRGRLWILTLDGRLYGSEVILL